MVEVSLKSVAPPHGALFVSTPVLWEYNPVKMPVRLGQQSGVSTYALLNCTASAPNNDVSSDMNCIESKRWSSVTIRTMFGSAFRIRIVDVNVNRGRTCVSCGVACGGGNCV